MLFFNTAEAAAHFRRIGRRLLPAKSSAVPDVPARVLLNERDRPLIVDGYSNDIWRVSCATLDAKTCNDLREIAHRLAYIARRMRHTADVHEEWNAERWIGEPPR